VDFLGFKDPQDRANALHDPDVQQWLGQVAPEELRGRGLGRRRLVDGNRPARELASMLTTESHSGLSPVQMRNGTRCKPPSQKNITSGSETAGRGQE
jgi:hypothetical protein